MSEAPVFRLIDKAVTGELSEDTVGHSRSIPNVYSSGECTASYYESKLSTDLLLHICHKFILSASIITGIYRRVEQNI